MGVWTSLMTAFIGIFALMSQQPSLLAVAIVPLFWGKITGWRNGPDKPALNRSFSSPDKAKSPGKVRLLQEDEYKTQSQTETRKALEDLRKHCHSPNSKKTVNRLKNQERFSEFVLGSSHLTENELLEWDQEPDMTAEDFEVLQEEDSEEDMDELDHYVSTRLEG